MHICALFCLAISNEYALKYENAIDKQHGKAIGMTGDIGVLSVTVLASSQRVERVRRSRVCGGVRCTQGAHDGETTRRAKIGAVVSAQVRACEGWLACSLCCARASMCRTLVSTAGCQHCRLLYPRLLAAR